MQTSEVYYCWSCDAHRRATTNAQGGTCCPKCGQALSDDCRVASSRGIGGLLLQFTGAPSPVAARSMRAAA
ncbi:MAG: hypothetical protein U0894_05185 [Pirellulales bacterium]